MASKRLIKELEAYKREPSSALKVLEPKSEDDLFHWVAVLRGPEGTAYEGGRFHLTITLPPTYPNTPPEIRFQTPICHPNVNFKTGEICLDLLKTSWTPAYGIVSTLEAVQQLLSAGGEPDSPLNIDLARLLREGDLVGAEGLVRFYTQMLAVPR
ncbi:hypothetical protein M409DRAFT_53330 [Zasmidium cellare ATCC 36951]|uniref:UBC core domain-containing protein n=1 Tax=Zasmidium cellare ATCC 36951 TaxID=1080233 RepID=A0A6A6CR83_ZASCE|nr:uncharacterized protein M409DRAFT_53330 [Zasmidium cellare ATCC 36951]KAF2167996.1 hypothetical protein M409DRAFT_53330 [Zasmidium cellare ATCC 36951]